MISTAHTFAYLPANVHACWQAGVRTYLLGVIGLVCLLPILVSSQPCPVTWGPTIQISNTPSSAFSPKLAVVGDTVHVVYHAYSVYYCRSTDAGKSWGPEVELIPQDSMSASLGNRPLAVSGQTVSLMWENRNSSGTITSIKIRRSTDGGETWLEPQVIIVNQQFTKYFNPIIAVRHNEMFVAVIRYLSGSYQCFLTRSLTAGVTWDSLRQITFISESHVLGDLQARTGALYLTFERAAQPSGREIAFMVSTDRGGTWSNEQLLSTIDTYQAWNPNVAADDAGNVYVCWQDAKYGSIGGFAGTVLLRRSTDNGQIWLPEVRVTPVPAANGSSIAVSGSIIHVGFGDERNGFQDATSRYTASTNWGETWCDEMTLGGPLRRALGPSVCSTEKRVYAIWSSDRSIPYDTTQVFMRHGDYITGVVEENPRYQLSSGVRLYQNYPNPFNNHTQIAYELPISGMVKLWLYDALGRAALRLVEGVQPAGLHTFFLDAERLSTGTYFLIIHFNFRKEVKKVLLVK